MNAIGYDYEDSDFNRIALGLLLVIFFLITSWVYANLPTESVRTGFYQAFLIFAILAFVVNWLSSNDDKIFSFAGFGKNANVLLISFLAGAGIYFLSAAAKLFAYGDTFQFPNLGIEQALYRNLYAPFIEEMFFAGALGPTLRNLIGSHVLLDNRAFATIISLLLNAAIFAGFHYTVTGGNLALLQGTFLFRLVVGIGNEIFQSTGFGLGAHIIANFTATS